MDAVSYWTRWWKLRRYVMAPDKLHAADTPVPVLAPGQGKTKTGRSWIYVGKTDQLRTRRLRRYCLRIHPIAEGTPRATSEDLSRCAAGRPTPASISCIKRIGFRRYGGRIISTPILIQPEMQKGTRLGVARVSTELGLPIRYYRHWPASNW